MYKKVFAQGIGKNQYRIHLWDDGGYDEILWKNTAYIECPKSEASYKGLKGEYLKKIKDWYRDMDGLHFHDMAPYQKFLIEKYGVDDSIPPSHKEVFFDIEIEMGGALTEDYIKSSPKPVTSIAWYFKQKDQWGILILDEENQLERTKQGNKHIIPVKTEEELLSKFIELIRSIDPDILVGYNSDYFDIPYLYHRICRVLGEDWANMLSPIGIVRDVSQWNKDKYLQIAGLECLDYMLMHKKYSWKDEPSYKLDVLGEKYAGLRKIEYNGSLDRLFQEDIFKFIEYNFRDVEILVEWDKKSQYLSLTKNLSHKGKINYSDVYASSKVHDGAISSYLLSQNIIPPSRDKNPLIKKNYAGGYLFCPKAGLYQYMFDEDLTSLYPSIIMSLNVGKETYVGRVLDLYNDRNNRLGLNDLKQKPPNEKLPVENRKGKQTYIECREIVEIIEDSNLAISANGVMFRKDKKSVLSVILNTWFDERVVYKGLMKKAYKEGNVKEGELNHLKQYTMKILLNSLYGATALKSFRYGSVILSEAITLSGQRIICESALCANRHINKVIKEGIEL
jgi:DNA polymerase elongation subunit (family B)